MQSAERHVWIEEAYEPGHPACRGDHQIRMKQAAVARSAAGILSNRQVQVLRLPDAK